MFPRCVLRTEPVTVLASARVLRRLVCDVPSFPHSPRGLAAAAVMCGAWHYLCLCLLFSSEPLFSKIRPSLTAKCQVELSAAALPLGHSRPCPVFEVILQNSFEQTLSLTSFLSWRFNSSCGTYQVILLTSVPCNCPAYVHGPTALYFIWNMENCAFPSYCTLCCTSAFGYIIIISFNLIIADL